MLFIMDLVLQNYRIYASIYLLIYTSVAVVLVSYVLYHGCYLDAGSKSRPSLKPKSSHKSVDVLEVLESAFVLVGSLTAIGLYAHSKLHSGDISGEFGAFCELTALSLFMVSQYAAICYIQYNIERTQRGPQVLVLSGAMSAVSIMYLFLFEYHHLISLLSTEEEHEFTDELKVAYSLFWCPIEYFVWSFVTVNHMLHHWRHQQAHSEPLKHSNSNHSNYSHSIPGGDTLLNLKVSSVAQVIALNAMSPRTGSAESAGGLNGSIRRRNSSMLFVQEKEERMELNPMAFSPTMTPIIGPSPAISTVNTMEHHELDELSGDDDAEL